MSVCAKCKRNPRLRLGDSSRYVKHLIRALRKSSMAYYFNYTHTAAEARYKHFTQCIKWAIWGFQMHEGLPRTGECDAATWEKLERFL
jgi:murein L,D-transpeptidase YcbB/YkuD